MSSSEDELLLDHIARRGMQAQADSDDSDMPDWLRESATPASQPQPVSISSDSDTDSPEAGECRWEQHSSCMGAFAADHCWSGALSSG